MSSPPSRFFARENIYRRIQRTLLLVTVSCGVIIAVLVGIALYQKAYAQTFFPGTKLVGHDLGGVTYNQALNQLSESIDRINTRGITIVYGDKTVTITPAAIASSPDSSFDLFHFDLESSLNARWRHGRSANLWRNLQEQARALVMSPDYSLDYYLDEQKLLGILQENFGNFEQPAQNAAVLLDNERLVIQPETYGNAFDYPAIIEVIKSHLGSLKTTDISIALQTDTPTTYAADLEEILPQLRLVVDKGPLGLALPAQSMLNAGTVITVPAKTLAPLLTADRTDSGQSMVGLKQTETEVFLQQTIAPLVTIDPVDAKFTVNNGKVTEFVASKPGQKLDVPSSFIRFEKLVQNVSADSAATTTVAVAIAALESQITNDTVNDLGITEIIGIGESNFSGSPPNRRHNISVGAAAVNGTLIKPGGEFSLLKVLGNIDAANGYLPELVIKGNQTVPEYGGGLCQIGTTIFRATLAAGLPVTARQNHSYRVSYYEPAGTDATIYDPAPDYRFVNDTGRHILIQSRIEGDSLYFDVWGTKDERQVTKTQPVIYNITPPPPTKLIETTTLAPGQRRCTERAHNGADAYFDYTVTYADGRVKEERFKSHYRPWQEVCLVGVEKNTTASSTPESLPASEN